MTTRIPLTEFNQIVQIKSSPETIAALLNEAESIHFKSQNKLHGNAKRVYPFWKICRRCLKPYPCLTKEQVTRNKYCGKTCLGERLAEERIGRPLKPLAERQGKMVACAVCGKEKWMPNSRLRRVNKPTCSSKCNGVLRGADWSTHAHKGRAAWTEQSEASYRVKMSGANNPAWKGGVTYFRKHGNYKPIKYVRCPIEFMAMARKDGYVMEHRLMVAQAIGRPLLRVEVVHHKDHDPTHNELSNFQLFASNRDHKLYEHHGSPAPIWQL